MSPRKICFLGNSHVGAIRLGLESARAGNAFVDQQIDVFGSHRDLIRAHEIAGGVLRPTSSQVRQNFSWTSGGQEEIDLRTYDLLVVVAGEALHDLCLFVAGRALPEIEADLIDEVLASWENSWWMQLGRDVAAAAPDLQVLHLGQPLISESAPHVQKLRTELLSADVVLASRLDRIEARRHRHITRRAGGSVAVVPPVPDVLDETGCFTRHEFSRGSLRLSKTMDQAHPENDYGHMNAAYGEIVLHHLLVAPA